MKTILSTLFLFGLTYFASAQVTAEDIVAMMDDLGTSPDKIETVYVGNKVKYFTDGTSKWTYSKYLASDGNGVTLADAGIRVNFKPDGTTTSIYYIPYNSITSLNITDDYLTIYLKR